VSDKDKKVSGKQSINEGYQPKDGVSLIHTTTGQEKGYQPIKQTAKPINPPPKKP
jgi:hypothetical protein